MDVKILEIQHENTFYYRVLKSSVVLYYRCEVHRPLNNGKWHITESQLEFSELAYMYDDELTLIDCDVMHVDANKPPLEVDYTWRSSFPHNLRLLEIPDLKYLFPCHTERSSLLRDYIKDHIFTPDNVSVYFTQDIITIYSHYTDKPNKIHSRTVIDYPYFKANDLYDLDDMFNAWIAELQDTINKKSNATKNICPCCNGTGIIKEIKK